MFDQYFQQKVDLWSIHLWYSTQNTPINNANKSLFGK